MNEAKEMRAEKDIISFEKRNMTNTVKQILYHIHRKTINAQKYLLGTKIHTHRCLHTHAERERERIVCFSGN